MSSGSEVIEAFDGREGFDQFAYPAPERVDCSFGSFWQHRLEFGERAVEHEGRECRITTEHR